MRMQVHLSSSTTVTSSGCWRSSRGACSTLSWPRISRPRRSRLCSWPAGATAGAQRQCCADDRARRRLGIERIELTDDDIARIDRLGETDAVAQLVEELPADQREAITARVIHEQEYDEIARELQLSETVVRKRVSRGLAALRRRMGGPS
jgi:RNA polymerase sigma factor (sigma-70 family)